MTPQEIRSIGNTRGISFSYYVNNKGSGRIRLKDNYFGTKKIISVDHSYRRTVHQALDYLANELGFQVQGVIINPDDSGTVYMKSFQSNIQLGGK